MDCTTGRLHNGKTKLVEVHQEVDDENNKNGKARIIFKWPVLLQFADCKDDDLSEKHLEALKTLEKDMAECGTEEEMKKYYSIIKKINPTFFAEIMHGHGPTTLPGRITVLMSLLYWVSDKVLEEGRFKPLFTQRGLKIYNSFVKKTCDILEGKEFVALQMDCKEIPEVEPDLNYMLKVTRKVAQLICDYVPNYYQENRGKYFAKAYRNYLLGYIWSNNYHLDKDIVSENSILLIRSSLAAASVCFELNALLKNCVLDEEIRDNPMFIRLLRAGDLIIALLNDILGIGGELIRKDVDNLIYLRMVKGKTLEDSLEYHKNILLQEFSDYLLLSKRIKNCFQGYHNLNLFLGEVDQIIYSYVPWHITCSRYKRNNTKFWIE